MNSGTDVSTKLSTVFQAMEPSGARLAGPPASSRSTTPASPRPKAIHSPDRSRSTSSPMPTSSTVSQLTAPITSSQLGGARGFRLRHRQLSRQREQQAREQLDHEKHAPDGHEGLRNPQRCA